MQNIETATLNMEQTNSDILELTDAELDAINGGNWLGDAFRAIGGAIADAASFVAHGFQSTPTNNPWRGPFQPHGGGGPA